VGVREGDGSLLLGLWIRSPAEDWDRLRNPTFTFSINNRVTQPQTGLYQRIYQEFRRVSFVSSWNRTCYRSDDYTSAHEQSQSTALKTNCSTVKQMYLSFICKHRLSAIDSLRYRNELELRTSYMIMTE